MRTLAPTLSVALIVKDAERTLAKCLQSVRPLAQQVIVLDTGSSDQSPEIAQHYADSFLQIEWQHDFAWARNQSLELAEQDWILILDADETISERFVRHYLAILEKYTQQKVLISLPCQDANGGDLRVPRLFPRALNLRFQGRVHEYLMSPSGEAYQSIYCPDLILLHDSQTSPEKQSAYMHLIQAELAQTTNPIRQATLYYHLGRSQQRRQPQLALVHFQQAFEIIQALPESKPLHLLHSILVPLSRLSADFLPAQSRLVYLEVLTQAFPDFAEGWLHLGYAYLEQQQWQESRTYFKTCQSLLATEKLPVSVKSQFRLLCEQGCKRAESVLEPTLSSTTDSVSTTQ